MKKRIFTVASSEVTIQKFSAPEQYVFPLQGFTSAVKKKEEVVRGDILARSSDEECIYAPCNGIVDSVSEHAIVLMPQDVEKETIASLDILSLPFKDKYTVLQKLGFSKIRKCSSSLTHIVVNALPADIGIVYIPTLFSQYTDILVAGMECLREMFPSVAITMAIPTKSQYSLAGVNTAEIVPEYPHTIDELVMAKIVRKESFAGVVAFSILDVWKLGKIVTEGLPNTHTILNINDNVVDVPIGYPVPLLLEKCGVDIANVASIAVNGMMRGRPLADINTGILADVFALHTLTASEVPPIKEDPCISCGYCTSVCPARLRVHLLNQFAERSDFEKCMEEHIEACFECGLCDYVCLAKRPLLQYLRYAKKNTATLLPMG